MSNDASTITLNSQNISPSAELSLMIQANRLGKCTDPGWSFELPAIYEHRCIWCSQDIAYVKLANGEEVAFDIFGDGNQRRIDLAKPHACTELPVEEDRL